MKKKRIIIILISALLVIGLIVIYQQSKTPKKEEVKEITELRQGTYYSFYPGSEQYMILSIYEDTKEFYLYKESRLINEGKYVFEENNKFVFEGYHYCFDFYYEDDVYICVLDELDEHYYMKYLSQGVVHYAQTEFE